MFYFDYIYVACTVHIGHATLCCISTHHVHHTSIAPFMNPCISTQAHKYTLLLTTGHRMTEYVITYLPIGKEDRRQIWSALDVLRT